MRNRISIGRFLIACIIFMQAIQVESNVIGFDLGSSFFKITLVKPGQPFAIVENFTSKRKTENSATFTDDTRLFGYDSFTESSKFPKTTF
jgi:molecular chaperone DnaK (HSP70)